MMKIYRSKLNEAGRKKVQDVPKSSQALTDFVNNLKKSNIEVNDSQYGVLDRLYNDATISLSEDFLKWPTLYQAEYQKDKYFEYAIKVLKVLREPNLFERYYPDLTDDEKKTFFDNTMPKNKSVVGYNKLSKTVQYYDLIQKQKRKPANEDFRKKLQTLADKEDVGNLIKFIIYIYDMARTKTQQIESDEFKTENPAAYKIIKECIKLYNLWENNSDNLKSNGIVKDLEDSILKNNAEIPQSGIPYSLLVRGMLIGLKPYKNLADFINPFVSFYNDVLKKKNKEV